MNPRTAICFVLVGLCLPLAPLCAQTPTPTPASGKILVKNALLLTMKPGEEKPITGFMLVGSDGRIARIGAGTPPEDCPAAEVYDAQGKIVLPGFISAHSHVWQSAIRGLAPDQHVDVWVNALYDHTVSHTPPEDFYWYTLHGSLDHLRHGVTTVYDFAYNRADGDFNAQQFRAKLDSGIRFVHSYSFPRLPLGQPPLTEEQKRQDLQDFLNFANAQRARPTFLKVSLAGFATSKSDVAFAGRMMREFGLDNQTHFLELPLNKEAQRARFAWFEDAGMLGPGLFFGHFIHTDEAMLRAVARAGSGMVWNPLSNGRLGSGVADIPKYLSMGVKVGMGVDGEASADIACPFENMRMGLYVIRAKYESANVMMPIDVLRLHTMGSAGVMGIADRVGSLEVGKEGDFVVVDPANMDTAPVLDPYATVVMACNVSNLERVYVGGDLLDERGQIRKTDAPKVQAELYRRWHVLEDDLQHHAADRAASAHSWP